MIGERLKHQFIGGEAWILSYREECFEQIGLKPSIKIPVFNGSLECEFRKYQMFDGKLKQFRSEGGIVKTEEEKRQMGEKHRFKKEREFKKRLDEQEENEDSDIRSFTFHSSKVSAWSSKDERKGEGSNRRKFKREDSDFKGSRGFKDSKDFKGSKDFRGSKDNRKPFKGENKGGHERFDRSGGKKPFKKFNRFNNEED
jgi:putative N6-adenine-specific DNA methylase